MLLVLFINVKADRDKPGDEPVEESINKIMLQLQTHIYYREINNSEA